MNAYTLTGHIHRPKEMPIRRFIFAAFALTVLAACQPAPSNDDSSQDVISPQAAVDAVRQVFQQYVDDWNAPDIDAVLAILDDDVVQMPPDTVIVGKDALGAAFRQYLEEIEDVWEPTIDEIQAAGNLVVIQGSFTETATPRAGGEPSTQTGNATWVFRRDPTGTWMLVLEEWFSTDAAG